MGKATFAYRAARRLLGAPADPAYGVLGASPDHPVSRQVIARSHPDLLVIERLVEGGKTRKVIPVDEARGLSNSSPSRRPARCIGWRSSTPPTTSTSTPPTPS